MEPQLQNQQHFLIVTYPAQGHINPSRHLARKLVNSTGARVTLSTAISGHRKMFTSLDEEYHDGLIYYLPYSDGYDEGFKKDVHDHNQFMTESKVVGSRTLTSVINRLAKDGRPVTCIIYTLLMSWVADVARNHGIPCALYWIQPATVLAVYYHYFHGYKDTITCQANDPMAMVKLPCLPPLKIRDLPSFLTITNKDDPYYVILNYFSDTFTTLERGLVAGEKPKVWVNSFDELEADAIKSVEKEVDLMGIGPVLSSKEVAGKKSKDLFNTDDDTYLKWLDTKPEKSVIYISFGSMSVMNKRQMKEISHALKETERPFLWVVRKDNREEIGSKLEELVSETDGLVVEWCNQLVVLRHPSVGCFVTHCGWNSTLETLACGVPAVGVPQWTDQGTNARLMEEWGIGVRAEVREDRVMDGEELKRCLEAVMGEKKIREMAGFWKERAQVAVAEGGSSERNLRALVAGNADEK
ncbi:UDP-glycosyltransferase 75C1-like [Carex rostrata]